MWGGRDKKVLSVKLPQAGEARRPILCRAGPGTPAPRVTVNSAPSPLKRVLLQMTNSTISPSICGQSIHSRHK